MWLKKHKNYVFEANFAIFNFKAYAYLVQMGQVYYQFKFSMNTFRDSLKTKFCN